MTASTKSIRLTPKKAAMIDAVKKTRRDRVFSAESLNDSSVKKGNNLRSGKVTNTRPEPYDRPQKINVFRIEKKDNFDQTQKMNKPRIDKVSKLRLKQATNLPPPTPVPPVVKSIPTVSPSTLRQSSPLRRSSSSRQSSPLRQRLASAKGNGKSKNIKTPKVMPLINGKPKTMSVPYSTRTKPLQRAQSNMASNEPRMLIKSPSLTILNDNNDDESVAPLVWEMPSWKKEQGRIHERLSQRFLVKTTSR